MTATTTFAGKRGWPFTHEHVWLVTVSRRLASGEYACIYSCACGAERHTVTDETCDENEERR